MSMFAVGICLHVGVRWSAIVIAPSITYLSFTIVCSKSDCTAPAFRHFIHSLQQLLPVNTFFRAVSDLRRRPDGIDPALRRPGRFDRECFFGLPSHDDRAAVLSVHTRR